MIAYCQPECRSGEIRTCVCDRRCWRNYCSIVTDNSNTIGRDRQLLAVCARFNNDLVSTASRVDGILDGQGLTGFDVNGGAMWIGETREDQPKQCRTDCYLEK